MAPTVDLGVGAMDEVLHRVVGLVVAQLPPENGVTTIDPDTELADVGFGSLAVVRFLVALEEEFEVEFPAEAIDGDVFSTPRAVADAVRVLRGEA